jgi:chromosome segregation ATPase
MSAPEPLDLAAIRARHSAWHDGDPERAEWPDDLAAVIVDAQSESPQRIAVRGAMAHEIVREDVPALLAALDAAHAETEQYRRNEVTLTNELSRAHQDAVEFCGQRDEARAALAALRERIEDVKASAMKRADRFREYAYNCKVRMAEDPPRLRALREQHNAMADAVEAVAHDLRRALAAAPSETKEGR